MLIITIKQKIYKYKTEKMQQNTPSTPFYLFIYSLNKTIIN